MQLLLDELTGAMRSLRKLKPAQENNFSLNDIDSFSKFISDITTNVNKGGWAIAALSLVVGMFGVANIMFVTVRERTSQIGVKKSVGCKKFGYTHGISIGICISMYTWRINWVITCIYFNANI